MSRGVYIDLDSAVLKSETIALEEKGKEFTCE